MTTAYHPIKTLASEKDSIVSTKNHSSSTEDLQLCKLTCAPNHPH